MPASPADIRSRRPIVGPAMDNPRWFYAGVPREYRLPSALDERVFTATLLRKMGHDVEDGELTPAAVDVFVRLAHWIVNDAPPRPGTAGVFRIPPVMRADSPWVVQVQQEAVVAVVHPMAPLDAFAAFRGLRPDLRARPTGFAPYTNAPRAALAGEVRRIALDLLVFRSNLDSRWP